MGVKFGMEDAKFHPHRCNVSPSKSASELIKYWQVCAARNAASNNAGVGEWDLKTVIFYEIWEDKHPIMA